MNTGVGSHSLLQGIFLTQGSNRSPVLQVDSLPSEPPRKPIIHYFKSLKEKKSPMIIQKDAEKFKIHFLNFVEEIYHIHRSKDSIFQIFNYCK